MLYVPRLAIQQSVPPILVETQKAANESFMRRLIQYLLHIINIYSVYTVYWSLHQQMLSSTNDSIIQNYTSLHMIVKSRKVLQQFQTSCYWDISL